MLIQLFDLLSADYSGISFAYFGLKIIIVFKKSSLEHYYNTGNSYLNFESKRINMFMQRYFCVLCLRNSFL